MSRPLEKAHLSDLVERLHSAFPSLNRQEQKVSVQIHRLLAQGCPITHQQVADSIAVPVETVNAMLNRWWGIHYDNQDRIDGYWGLSIEPTAHRFELDRHTLYTWCAWDSLFLPEILQTGVRIESQCALTGTKIHLELDPDGVQRVQPGRAVMSFVTADTNKVKGDVVTHFCHLVHFFESANAGAVWTEKHPGTFLLSIGEAHILGRLMNAVQYPDIFGKQGDTLETI